MPPQHHLPADIERTSMGIITAELAARGLAIPPENAAVVKRVIHTTADFDYAENLRFTPGAAAAGVAAMRAGAVVITDTNMALAGITKPGLAKLGGQAACYMADPEVAARAQGFSLPVVYNTGGYETVDAVRALAGYVDIWLADYKYADSALAAELSAARDYPAVADAALRQMLLQTGAPVYDADGYLQKGVIVRHLALPGHVADSKAVLRRLAALREETGVEFIPSLMSQFTPFYKAAEHGLGRRITTYEYRQVIDEAVRLGLTDGYMQEKSSAREEYTPPFDLEGV